MVPLSSGQYNMSKPQSDLVMLNIIPNNKRVLSTHDFAPGTTSVHPGNKIRNDLWPFMGVGGCWWVCKVRGE